MFRYSNKYKSKHFRGTYYVPDTVLNAYVY